MRRITVPSLVSREGRLVDRAVGGDEPVVGAVQCLAGVVRGRPRASPRSATGARGGRGRASPIRAASRLPVIVPSDFEQRAAIGDRDGLPASDLADGAVVADEEAALGDVRLRRRGREGQGDGQLLPSDRDCQGEATHLGQPPDGVAEAARPDRRCEMTL